MKQVNKDLNWHNIDHEIFRCYTFIIDGKPAKLRINNPVLLNVSKSGGHRILDKDDVSYYVPYKWLCISWETNDEVAFRF
jgi:hypothetical protein